MATLKEQMTTDLAAFFSTDDFAETATYRRGIASSSISVIFDNPRAGVLLAESYAAEYTPTAHCKASDIETDCIGDVLEIGSVFYNITNCIISEDGLVATLVLSKE